MKALLGFIIIGLIATPVTAKEWTFREAKRALEALYKDNSTSFYCGCDYQRQERTDKPGKTRLEPDLNSCGYTPRKNASRAQRIEWEHIVPASHYGKHMQCWKDGGRKNCKKDKKYNKLASDMHTLVPSIGEANGDRSNFKFGMLEGERRQYGRCDFEIDFKARIVEPAPNVRGDIARAYLYMADEYNIRLSKQQRQLFGAWHKTDPVDRWERTKNKRVQRLQGKANPYIQ